MREVVNGQWEDLGREVKKGKNLFLFPEGTFSITGWVNNIRNGPNILHSMLDNPAYIPITFTYDMLSYNKTVLHIGIGKPFYSYTNNGLNEMIRDSLSDGYTVTPANLTALLITEFENSSKEEIIEKYFHIAENIHKGNIYFSECLNDKIMPDKLIKKAIQDGFLIVENNQIRHTDKMKQHHGNLIKKNPWFYHANQLHGLKGKLLNC